MPSFKHLVVLMLENRSFDNMLGFAYNRQLIPAQRRPFDGRIFFGLDFDPSASTPVKAGDEYWNPSNIAYFSQPSTPAIKVSISPATDFSMPHPDPGEHFDRIVAQIFGPGMPASSADCNMLGFLLDFARSAGSVGAARIMQYYTPDQVPVITSLARQFAVCDRWFASSPTQTLPNRAFVHTGTANGKVNNRPYDPFDFNVKTIFNVLEDSSISWAVYKDTHLHGLDQFSGTRVQFPELWELPAGRFKYLEEFHNDAAHGTLPKYSFIEPRLLIDGNDQHPPRDIRLGEILLYDVYQSISKSPDPGDIVLVVIYDEHGGCYDHVPPPFGAVAPDQKPGELGFAFDRYGVRIPAIVVSPYVEQGTVFRSEKRTPEGREIPFDHTSVLATLRDWLTIDSAKMLSSQRVKVAPTFLDLLSREKARAPMPSIDVPHNIPKIERVLDFADEANDLQIAFAMGVTRWADHLHGTRVADDPALVHKLESRVFLIPHVLEEMSRIKQKQIGTSSEKKAVVGG